MSLVSFLAIFDKPDQFPSSLGNIGCRMDNRRGETMKMEGRRSKIEVVRCRLLSFTALLYRNRDLLVTRATRLVGDMDIFGFP